MLKPNENVVKLFEEGLQCSCAPSCPAGSTSHLSRPLESLKGPTFASRLRLSEAEEGDQKANKARSLQQEVGSHEAILGSISVSGNTTMSE